MMADALVQPDRRQSLAHTTHEHIISPDVLKLQQTYEPITYFNLINNARQYLAILLGIKCWHGDSR